MEGFCRLSRKFFLLAIDVFRGAAGGGPDGLRLGVDGVVVVARRFLLATVTSLASDLGEECTVAAVDALSPFM